MIRITNATHKFNWRFYVMKTIGHDAGRILAVAIMIGALTATCSGQDVPKGVNYKKATAEINAKSKASLEQALANPGTPTEFLSQVISCGPILWNDLKEHQDSLSKDSTPVTMMLSIPEPLKTEGRGFRTQEQRDKFWKLVLDKYPALRKGVVRPARANEIQFFWTTIPFDIEEPLFTIETPTDVFVANLRIEKDTVVLFWLDRVDDLRKLKK
jgi:hypothetical protein